MKHRQCTAPRTLIIGGSGFLGTELTQQAVAAGHSVVATYTTRPGDNPHAEWQPLDLRDADRLDALMVEAEPQIIINASSGGADWEITAAGPIQLALQASRHGVQLIQVSTDAVFSGADIHYYETDLPDPITPYGAAKAAAETGVLAVHPMAVVARTSLIIGNGRSTHERLVHDLVAGTVSGALYTDDTRCPVHVADLAAALLELSMSGAAGVRHLAGADFVSRHELGVLIAERDGLDHASLPAGLRAHSALPGALDVRLDIQATQRKLRTRLRGAREFLLPEALETDALPYA